MVEQIGSADCLMKAGTQQVLIVIFVVAAIIGFPYVIAFVGDALTGSPKARPVSVSEMSESERLQAACDEVESLNEQMTGAKFGTKHWLSTPIRPELRSLHETTCGW
ncbi:MAG: hypothetical protein ACLQUZ_16205 [Rhizomicrobium sp.]